MFQYLTAFHWAITQMTPGSMPVHPLNSYERIFNIICLFFGLLFFSSVISSMTTTLTEIKMQAFERENIVRQLEQFFRQKSVSRILAVTFKKQVIERMSQRKPLEMKNVTAIPMVSLTLREDLTLDLCRPHLTSHQLFRIVAQTDALVFRQLCTAAVTFDALLPGDLLFVQDTPCQVAYLVTSGLVGYTADQMTSRWSNDATVGEKGWLSWVALWTEQWTHVGRAEAKHISEIMVLNGEAVFQCVDRCAELRALFEEYCIAFHQRLVTASPVSSGMWPNDVEVPLTEFGEIMLGVRQREQQFVGMKVLQMIQAQQQVSWMSSMTSQHMHDLQREVVSGRCVLVESPDGSARRVVGFTGIRLQREDGSLLTILAKKRLNKSEWEPDGQLPGVKQDPGELPHQALRRLLRERLGPFSEEIRVLCAKREDRHEESVRYGIKTQYIRVVYGATLQRGDASPVLLGTTHQRFPSVFGKSGSLHSKNLSSRGALFRMPDVKDCYLLKDGRNEFIASFVQADMLDVFRKVSGQKVLQKWIKSSDCEKLVLSG